MIEVRPTYSRQTRKGRLTLSRTRLVAWNLLCLLLPAMVDAGMGVNAQELVQSEARLKAAFIFNFAKFVEWPAQAFSQPNSPLVVGVLGKDTIGAALDQVVNGKLVNGRLVVVRRFAIGEELQTCHILFVSARSEANLARIIQGARSASVLTVGETEDFLKAGGIIRFVTVKDRLQFEISSAAVEHSSLKISSRLMRLARRPPE